MSNQKHSAATIIATITLTVTNFFLQLYVLQYTWNNFFHKVFNIPTITYWQGLVITVSLFLFRQIDYASHVARKGREGAELVGEQLGYTLCLGTVYLIVRLNT